ncbi:Putative ammonium transporter 1 member 5 [Geodia barretti]|uniref:Ammonium transporter 1 member 5 n=1 Tax=Geodia barretti TaxID=519541 RepID=A0AA35SCZ4_GEOBA|nr:Putative ammonium transporter 1 member 5 [Geodia barretti]
MFFMKAGFLYVEVSFSKQDKRRRVVLAKYIDIFAGTFGFWLFGYAVSGNTDQGDVGEEQDYIFWFFRYTFATNTATIIGGTLVGHDVQMRAAAAFVYSFVMTAFIHPSLARIFWSSRSDPGPFVWSPYETCNGTFTGNIDHRFSSIRSEDLGIDFVFFDFAGSGLVHVVGGMGGFMLSLFHKLETSKKTRKLQQLPLLKKEFAMVEIHRAKPQIRDEMVQSGAEPGEETKKPQSFIQWMYPSGGGEENVESAALGIIILWTTWFAFNCGSTETIAGKTSHAAVGRIALTMCLAAASGGITQCIVSGLVQIYNRHEHFNTNEMANAVLANLVAVTGCCPFVDPPFAILIGPLTVLFYHGGCYIEYLLKLHDGARVFPVHAVSGFWGLLCVGIFGRTCLILEVYESLCYCVSNDLPSNVRVIAPLLAIVSVMSRKLRALESRGGPELSAFVRAQQERY